MKVTKTIGLLCVLILALPVVHSTSAALPYSTYGSENKWAGYKDYTEDNFDVRVVFNVYAVVDGQFDWPGDPSAIETDKYIYVYEIGNNGDQSNNHIGDFSLLYADGSAIPQHLMHNTTSQNDSSGGIAPDAAVTASQGEWVWSTDNGYIEAGQHSWLLMFSSDHAPTTGKFVFQEGQTEPPAPTPEPASIILFGSAAGWILTRRNNKHRSS
ncbi:MAG: PEP-CTERM sorting domain-containing protein [Sedimentisphaerales bacterium]